MCPPSTEVAQISSQQVLAQAAQQLLDSVRENGAEPSPFAVALLELMEHSSKLQEYENMMTVANQEAKSDEAKTWQQVSLMTLQYCQKNLVEQQQRALQKVTHLVEQGESLFLAPETEKPPELPDHSDKDASENRVPPSTPPPPAPTAAPKEKTATPLTPPGVWVTRPPPGLEAPPGLEPAPLTTTTTTSMVEVKKAPLAPWRKAAAEKKAKEEMEAVSKEAVSRLGINFDAFSDDDEN